MYLTGHCLALVAFIVPDVVGHLAYGSVQIPHLRVFRFRLGGIPVVSRPGDFPRPTSFKRPTTTPRPFRRRTTVQPAETAASVENRPMTTLGARPPEFTSFPFTLSSSPVLSSPADGQPALRPPRPPPIPATSLPSPNPLELPLRPSTAPQVPGSSSQQAQPITSHLSSGQHRPSSSTNAQAPTNITPPRPTPNPRPPPPPPPPSPPQLPPLSPFDDTSQHDSMAQPPLDMGPHRPPKPPPAPVAPTTNYNLKPVAMNGKPQRPFPSHGTNWTILQPPPQFPPPHLRPTTESPELIFNESSNNGIGKYNFDFLISNSISRKEQGFLKKSLVRPGRLVHVKTGAYSFKSPEGSYHRVDFVADENGYRAFVRTS